MDWKTISGSRFQDIKHFLCIHGVNGLHLSVKLRTCILTHLDACSSPTHNHSSVLCGDVTLCVCVNMHRCTRVTCRCDTVVTGTQTHLSSHHCDKNKLPGDTGKGDPTASQTSGEG